MSGISVGTTIKIERASTSMWIATCEITTTRATGNGPVSSVVSCSATGRDKIDALAAIDVEARRTVESDERLPAGLRALMLSSIAPARERAWVA